MIFPSVNIVSVVAAATINMIIGFSWYSPYVLGKPWMKLMGFTEKAMTELQKSMGPLYGLSFLGAIIQAAVITVILKLTLANTLEDALLISGAVWLGFVAVTQLTDALFNGKKFSPHLLAINTSYQLISILAMTTVLYLF
jgi:hypothetical protein